VVERAADLKLRNDKRRQNYSAHYIAGDDKTDLRSLRSMPNGVSLHQP